MKTEQVEVKVFANSGYIWKKLSDYDNLELATFHEETALDARWTTCDERVINLFEPSKISKELGIDRPFDNMLRFIVDVANFLNTMGAKIKGAGTDVIKITGVKTLKGCTYSVIPDQIEAGTYMVAAAATRGDVTLLNVIPKHLESITAKLLEMGVDVEEGEDSIRIMCNHRTSGANVKTLPYPGFPTDLQQPMTVLFSISNGRSIVIESIWESRFKYVDELKRMGANIKVEGKMAVVDGVEQLTGAQVVATDLRGGAAMVVAGLIADGCTSISDIYHIERGYERIHEKLKSLGADIEKIND
jgi:UDP-N-acetylglucosamine 1-carboxyvinyltransferase